AAASGGALAAAGAGGLVALVTSAPLAAAAVTVGVLAVAGLGVAGALGVFSPESPPAAESSPTGSTSPDPSSDGGTSTTPSDTGTDPTSPSNIPTEPVDESAPPATDTGTTATGEPAPVGSTPEASTTGGTTDPGTSTDVPTDPGSGTSTDTPTAPTPDPTPDPAPAPAPPALDLSLAPVTLAAREPADLLMTAANTGGRSAEEVVVDLTLPAGVSAPSSPLVARGTAVAGPLAAAALPCGSATGQPDGTSLVTCSVGVLSPGASQDLLVQVVAQSGGEYAFAADLRAKGVEPVRRTFAPTPVRHYGPEIRVSTTAPSFDNPGDGVLRVTVRNSGDKPAVEPSVTAVLPAGLR